jgi:hypothetical protein
MQRKGKRKKQGKQLKHCLPWFATLVKGVVDKIQTNLKASFQVHPIWYRYAWT